MKPSLFIREIRHTLFSLPQPDVTNLKTVYFDFTLDWLPTGKNLNWGLLMHVQAASTLIKQAFVSDRLSAIAAVYKNLFIILFCFFKL